MRAASARRWPASVALLALVAFGLRAWGSKNGLPYVFNADENAHFVPRAIGMFGHSYNPDYFINPPAFTYLLHVLFWLRWGNRDAVGHAFAVDPGTAFWMARLAAGALGAIAVALLTCAGARLFDRRTGLLAGGLLCVAFLPVSYGRLALNDAPALAPVCLALLGVAGIVTRGRRRDFLVAGAGMGLAAATKYTAGIVVLAILAAALVSPGVRAARPRTWIAGIVAAGVAAIVLFVLANPYAVLDAGAFRAGLAQQSAASSDTGGKLGLGDEPAILYYVSTLTWGLGWVPLVAAAGGAVWLGIRRRALALVLVPAPLAMLVFLGAQHRFFARWMLPAYPFLALLAAAGAMALVAWLSARWRARAALAVGVAAAAVALCAQGVVTSVHNAIALSRPDTRALARAWMVAHVPEGSKVVIEPIAPDQWASDVGRPSAVTGNGARWNKWPTSRSRVRNDGTLIPADQPGRIVKLEDYERTTRPDLVGAYARGGYCWVLIGSTQYGRAYADPAAVPNALPYYAELRRQGTLVYRVSPWRGGGTRPFSFDSSFNAYPLGAVRSGPEIEIYRLHTGTCGPGG